MAIRLPFSRKPAYIAVLGATLLTLGGCSVLPIPLTDSEVRTRVDADQMQLYVEQEQVAKPISFEEAVARALKYNLDYRLKQMESALASGLANLSRYDMLPNLLTSAGYAYRNNLNGSRSFRIENGQAIDSNPPVYTGGQERNRMLASAEFSWNVLDFGVSYYRARQQADQFLIAEERRSRVIQNILQDTRSAYWRAVGAQRLAGQAEVLNARVRSALERSREAETKGLLPPKDALTYQRLLLDAVQLLAARRQELEFAKRELAALMNITPGTDFTLVEADESPLLPVPVNTAELEELALSNRPELREEDYRVRITADEARRQITTLLPGISFNAGPQYDSNAYLYNNNWVDAGVRVSFNLFKALSLPAMKDVHEAQKKADQARRLALSMAILTQVRVSIERYRLALVDLDIARESSTVDQRLAIYARAAENTRTDSEQETIRAETRALNSEYQRYAAYAAAQTAYGRIYNSLGLEVVPANIDANSVAELAQSVAQNIESVEKDTFPNTSQASARLPPLRLQIELPTERGDLDPGALRKAVETNLARNQVRLRGGFEAGPTLLMKLSLAPAKDGVRQAYWDISLTRSDGSVGGSTRYASTLPADASNRTVNSFTEAATINAIRHLAKWIETPSKP